MNICPNPADCCRELTRVWSAIGIECYNGKSASENVKELCEAKANLLATVKDLLAHPDDMSTVAATKNLILSVEQVFPSAERRANSRGD